MERSPIITFKFHIRAIGNPSSVQLVAYNLWMDRKWDLFCLNIYPLRSEFNENWE